MPEGDTVWRTCQRLDAALRGAVLTRTDLRWPNIATADLTGRATIEVVARGKHILHRVEGGWTLHSHLRMEGSWRVKPTTTPPTAYREHRVRAVVGSAQNTAVGRSLGMLDLIRTGEEHTLVGHLGPDILGADWDADVASANVAAAGTSVAAALVDQRHLAGIGTFWASETLFLERLHPATPVGELPEERVAAIVLRAQRLMDRGRKHWLQSSTGITRPGEEKYVHGRGGRPCRRCGAGIEIQWEGPKTQERTFFYCPRCQPPPQGMSPRQYRPDRDQVAGSRRSMNGRSAYRRRS